MKIAVIGGGINGLCIAWEAAERGAKVILFERNKIMLETSSASSKLLHGGLRYLENFEFKLVREALKERNWWIENVPDLAHPIEIHLPITSNTRRSIIKYKIGLALYDSLAGNKGIKRHQWLGKSDFQLRNPQLIPTYLRGGFVFFDGQMNDYKLGCWVAEQAISCGMILNEKCTVSKLNEDGQIFMTQNEFLANIDIKDAKIVDESFDFVINATGSHVTKLLRDSCINPMYEVDHIRGSHLIFDRPLKNGYILEVPDEKRIFFVLPYENKTLVGTTEVRQLLSESVQCSEYERDYLIKAYNHYFSDAVSEKDIVDSFAGLRPLIKSANNPTKASREYAIQQNKKLITVYGGKWTTARALAKKVCNKIGLSN